MNKQRGWLRSSPKNEFSVHMGTLKDRLEKDPVYFEELIDRVLIRNSHRVLAVVKPDAGHAEKK